MTLRPRRRLSALRSGRSDNDPADRGTDEAEWLADGTKAPQSDRPVTCAKADAPVVDPPDPLPVAGAPAESTRHEPDNRGAMRRSARRWVGGTPARTGESPVPNTAAPVVDPPDPLAVAGAPAESTRHEPDDQGPVRRSARRWRDGTPGRPASRRWLAPPATPLAATSAEWARWRAMPARESGLSLVVPDWRVLSSGLLESGAGERAVPVQSIRLLHGHRSKGRWSPLPGGRGPVAWRSGLAEGKCQEPVVGRPRRRTRLSDSDRRGFEVRRRRAPWHLGSGPRRRVWSGRRMAASAWRSLIRAAPE